MATKRSRLPAGVSLLEDGRYKVRVTATDPVTGRRRQRQEVLEGADLAQAVARLDALRAELETGAPTRPPTLAVYSAGWIKRRSKRVRRKTLETYARRIGHLLEHLGHVTIDALQRHHLTWYRDKLGEQDVSAATAKSRWRDAKIVLRDAFAEHGLPDLTARIAAPVASGGRRRELVTLSHEEVAELLDVCTGRYRALIRFLARTGARLGEGRGLRWCDVDLDASVAYVRQSVTEVDSGRSWQTSAPKNGTPRTVGLTADLVEAIRTHRAECPGVGEALVWGTSGGTPARYATVIGAMRRAAKRAGLEVPVSPQVLRRTFNSLALAKGVDRVLLQGMVGHAGDAMSAHYHGLRPETAARTVEEVWG